LKGKLLHLLLVMALVFSVAMPAALAEDVEEVYFFSSIGGLCGALIGLLHGKRRL